MYNERKNERKNVEECIQTEMGRVLSNLAVSVEAMNEEINDLELRLGQVLSGGGLAKGGSDKTLTPEYNTKLAQEINSRVRFIEDLTDKLRHIKRRIEL